MKSETQSALKVDTVAVFFDVESIEAAIKELRDKGISDAQMGLACSESAFKAKLGHLVEQLGGDGDAPDTGFVGKKALGDTPYAAFGAFSVIAGAVGGGALVASAGVLGGALAVATAASGVIGGIGALTAGIISKSDADALQEQLDSGHILLFVRTGHNKQKDEVVKVLTDKAGIAPRTLTPVTVSE